MTIMSVCKQTRQFYTQIKRILHFFEDKHKQTLEVMLKNS